MKRLDRLYIRVDAQFPEDERYQALPYPVRDRAWALLLVLIGWSREKRTDGRIPGGIAPARALAMGHSPRLSLLLLAALKDAGLIMSTDDGWQIPAYGKWQETAAEIDRASSAGRIGGYASSAARRNGSSTDRERTVQRIVNEASSQTEIETEREREQEGLGERTSSVHQPTPPIPPLGGRLKIETKRDWDRSWKSGDLYAAMADAMDDGTIPPNLEGIE
ncbi:MAG: hypothetical protein J2P41_22710 [Blastocatellia bacterium]|nr:hypothetical protein [Blastocatellia bacterium]